MMSFLHADTPLALHILLVGCYGVCLSIMFTSVNTLTVSELDEHNASAGSTMLSVVQQVGIGLGIAISAVILNGYRYFIGDTGEELQQAFSYTFLTSAIFGILLTLVLTKLNKYDGEHLHKR